MWCPVQPANTDSRGCPRNHGTIRNSIDRLMVSYSISRINCRTRLLGKRTVKRENVILDFPVSSSWTIIVTRTAARLRGRPERKYITHG